VKLTGSAIILQDKLLRYLLIPRGENDKSKFLASAGYTLANHALLERDLRRLIENHEISHVETSPYGIKYEVRGTLNGPNGRVLHIVTIWITMGANQETRFVTLFPDRKQANDSI
jgi:hypothetical protein